MPRCRVSDAQEELEVARARGELSRLMRQNDSLEQELEEMDKKIGLLVQNRISVQDVIADRKKGRDQLISVWLTLHYFSSKSLHARVHGFQSRIFMDESDSDHT